MDKTKGRKREIFTARRLMETEFPEPSWVIPNIFPEGLILLAGKPKVGKSLLALNLGLSIASGGKALGEIKVDEGCVLYLGLEDDGSRLKTRLSSMLDGGRPLNYLQFVWDWPRLDEGGREEIEQWVRKHRKARLVIIDTLARFRPIRRGSTYQGDYDILEELKSLARQCRISILLVHHLRKTPSKDRPDEILGSTGLTGSADTIAALNKAKKKVNATANLWVSGRDIADMEFALKFDESTLTWSLLGEAEEYERSPEREEIIHLLGEKGSLHYKEIAEKLGKNHGAVKKLLSTMFHSGEVERKGQGHYELFKFSREPGDSRSPR